MVRSIATDRCEKSGEETGREKKEGVEFEEHGNGGDHSEGGV